MTKTPKTRPSLRGILEECLGARAAQSTAPDAMLNSLNADGDTPLHVMLWQKNAYAIRLLIEAGADVNAIGDMAETPLHIAVRQQDIEAVKALLNAGAATSHVSHFGQSAQDIATEHGGEIQRLFAVK